MQNCFVNYDKNTKNNNDNLDNDPKIHYKPLTYPEKGSLLPFSLYNTVHFYGATLSCPPADGQWPDDPLTGRTSCCQPGLLCMNHRIGRAN